MTLGAQGLPVVTVPKQTHITTVRDDMVDHGSSDDEASGLAMDTQRVVSQPCEPSPPPPVIIPTLARRGAFRLIQATIGTWRMRSCVCRRSSRHGPVYHRAGAGATAGPYPPYGPYHRGDCKCVVCLRLQSILEIPRTPQFNYWSLPITYICIYMQHIYIPITCIRIYVIGTHIP